MALIAISVIYFLSFQINCYSVFAQERITINSTQILQRDTVTEQVNIIPKSNSGLVCPSQDMSNLIFAIQCNSNADCKFLGRTIICCNKKCLGGIKPKRVVSEIKTQYSVELKTNAPAIPNLTLVCPPTIAETQSQNQTALFSIACDTANNCNFLGKNVLCCNRICTKGTLVPQPQTVQLVRDVEIIPSFKSVNMVCPNLVKGLRPQGSLFTIPCASNKDCAFLGNTILCCSKKCVKGIAARKPEPPHTPRFFGLVDTICPKERISEALEVKLCENDNECGGRICCPDINGKNYCRTPAHKFDKIPGSKQFEQPLKNIVSFMQCTPPPPAIIDIFPKSCKINFDCFPNLCCQENDKKYCRPPKKSFIAAVVSRLGTSPVTKSFIQRITT